jgi:hypothetical protein
VKVSLSVRLDGVTIKVHVVGGDGISTWGRGAAGVSTPDYIDQLERQDGPSFSDFSDDAAIAGERKVAGVAHLADHVERVAGGIGGNDQRGRR